MTVFFSVGISLLPWLLSMLGILTDAAVLEYYSTAFGIGALVLTGLYLRPRVESPKIRWLIFLMNPAIYYLAGLQVLLFLLASDPWNGFHLT